MSARRWRSASKAALLLAVFALSSDIVLVRRAMSPDRVVATLVPSGIVLGQAARITPADDSGVPPDPFSADRGHKIAETPSVPDSDTTPLLVGTLIVPGRFAVAVCQTHDAPPQSIHVGERLGDLTLVDVGQARAVFRRPDGTRVTLFIPKPGA